jgi:hypothetical protein
MPRPAPRTRERRPELLPIIREYFLDETSVDKLKAEDEERYGDQYHYNEDVWTLMDLEYRINEPKLKALWRAYRDEIVGEYAEKHPCQRPSMWWRLSKPGKPRHFGKGLYENPAVFLKRHNLLSEAEQQYLESHPELKKPARLIIPDDVDE